MLALDWLWLRDPRPAAPASVVSLSLFQDVRYREDQDRGWRGSFVQLAISAKPPTCLLPVVRRLPPAVCPKRS